MIKSIKSIFTLAFALMVLFPVLALGQTSDLTISVNPDDTSSWTIDEKIYGKFIEHNGKDVYPGLYAQHLANSSFERWFHLGDQIWQKRTAVLYQNTPNTDGIAYPWEPDPYDNSTKEMRTEDSVAHANHYQRIEVSGGNRGGVRQRTALPDQRTQVYKFHMFTRGTIDSASIRLESLLGDEVYVSKTVAIDSTWRKDTLTLDLNGTYTGRYNNSTFGKYALGIVIEGDGYLDVDGTRLMSGDAIRGKYNPTTIEYIDEYNVTSIRWPGGNWASAYHWMDGVGPIQQRPVKHNLAWGGLESNFMGTQEFLEFCEIAGITPYLNIGFNPSIGPEEAADWVEYVNGSTDTEMGQLRAEHGHPEPYNITHWQVGNEVYGSYQIGHTNAEDFARQFVDYYQAMKAVDSDIKVVAAGIDPLYTNYDEDWNRKVFSIAGENMDGIDIHRYVNGVVLDKNRDGWDENEYLRNMVAFPTQYEKHVIDRVMSWAEAYDRPDMIINVGEWNLQAKVNSGWPRPNYPTMAHASFVAGMFNVFMRNGDAVKYSYQRDNTLFYRPFPIDLRPVNPGNYVSKYYAQPFTETDNSWHSVYVTNDSPSFFMRQAGVHQTDTENVPYVDATAIRSHSGNKLYLFLTNRSIQYSFDANVELHRNWKVNQDVSFVKIYSDDPFSRQTSWTNRNGFNIQKYTQSPDNNNMQITLEPTSVYRLEMDVENSTPIAGVNPNLPTKLSLDDNYPNPFNPSTTIPYALPEATDVKLEVFNAVGQRVATLVNGRKQAGRYKVTWNADGHSSGVYYYKLTASSKTEVAPMTLVK